MQPVISNQQLLRSVPEIRLVHGTSEKLKLVMDWDGPVCRVRLTNEGALPVNVQEVLLFTGVLPAEDIPFYGEGFQQNGQRGGTLQHPEDIGCQPDRLEFKLPQAEGQLVAYSLAILQPTGRPTTLMAFTSCHRFSGEFRFCDRSFEVVLDTEGLTLAAGETWVLEEFMLISGESKADLLNSLASRIEQNHPRLVFPVTPAGWCSWYTFGPDVTEGDVLRNLEVIARDIPGLKFIQIDDGYQPFMGDWLEPGDKFPHGIRWLCEGIRNRGFEPAIWVAPFIAGQDSKLFRDHPDWFVTGQDGKPVRAEEVSYGGWRCTPWYVLDGTHPRVHEHFSRVFQVMHEEWGCTYFKLDACFWGALHQCHRNDPNATRIEAYRRGMEAILRGARGSFILGCNAPVWGSMGLVHGNRVTNDIMRTWDKFKVTACELFNRNWQNNHLWINDPDCLILNNAQGSRLTPDEFSFHIAMIQASGGMILSGDDMTALNPSQLEVINRLLPPGNRAVRFKDDSFSIGVQEFPDHQVLFFFNWDDQERNLQYELSQPVLVADFWSSEKFGVRSGSFSIDLSPHSARVFILSIPDFTA
jgi:alpha-galactosidase